MSNVNVGLTVTRGVANGITPIQSPSQNTVALLMKRMRGVEGKVYTINSPEDDEKHFGGSYDGAYGFEIVRNLFLNAAPFRPTIYGARLVASDASAATASIEDVGSGLEIDLTAGSLGEVDKGAWANDYTGSISITPIGNTFMFSFILRDPNGETVENETFASLAELINFLSSGSSYVAIDGTPALPATITAAPLAFPSYTPARPVTVNSSNGFLVFEFDNTDLPKNVFFVGARLVVNTVEVGSIATLSFQVGTTTTKVFVSLATGFDLSSVVASTDTDDWSVAFAQKVHPFTLTGGADGTLVESDAYPSGGKGLAVFDDYNLKVVSVVDFFSPTMFVFGRDYAANRQDTFYVQSMPLNVTRAVVTSDYLPVIRTGSASFGASYFGWNNTFVPHQNTFGLVPGIGYVIGAGFIRTPAAAGGFIHIPPAGLGSIAADSIGFFPESFSQADINYYTQQVGINVIQTREGIGSYIVTSRTTSSNPLYHSIHTILQANFYQKILQDNMLWALQVPNTPELKDRIVGYLTDFFFTEYENGALERTVPFSQAFSAIDRSGNDRKIVDFEIRYIPSESTESLVLRLNRNDGSLIVSLQN